jgi:hypothetical protein
MPIDTIVFDALPPLNAFVDVASSRVVVVTNWAEELKELAQRAASTRAAR